MPRLKLLRFGKIDRDVPRGAHNARSTVDMGVASDGLEQKGKTSRQAWRFSRHKYVISNHRKLRRLMLGLVIRITFRVPYFDSVKKE
jgi:hypothetical protein